MFNNNNEANDDDDFFIPTSSSASNLANLFGGNADTQVKSSLTYIPPKQPKTNGNPVSPASQKKLVCMKTITLSQLVNATYSVIGKFGIAIISDQVTTDLIIYKTKQNVLSTSKLSGAFHYTKINEFVIKFVDDQSISWMVTFDCLKDIMDFTDELSKQGIESTLDTTPQPQNIPDTNSASYNQRLVAEKPEEEDKVRADILGRISKMGLSILPGGDALPSPSPTRVDRELSESEPEDVIRTMKTRKVRLRHSESAMETMDLVAKTTSFPAIPHPHQMMDPLNVYFAENRTHNSEVRMNIAQLNTKIDALLSEQRPQSSANDVLERRILELERKLEFNGNRTDHQREIELEQRIEQLTKDNARTIVKYDDIIIGLHTEIEDLKRCLDAEKATKEKLNETEDRYRRIEEQNKRENDGWTQKEIEHQQQMEELSRRFTETQENLENANRTLVESNQNFREIKQELETTKNEYELLQKTCQQLNEHKLDVDIITEIVKQTMNTMYQNVLTDTGGSDTRDLKKILQKQLKATTFAIIAECSKILTGTEEEVEDDGGHYASVSEFEVTV